MSHLERPLVSADLSEQILEKDVRRARHRLERAERALRRATVSLAKRQAELAAYQASGKTPARKSFRADVAFYADLATKQQPMISTIIRGRA